MRRWPATMEPSGWNTGSVGTCNWKIGRTPAATLHASVTRSTSPDNSSVRVQLWMALALAEYALVRSAETTVTPPTLDGVMLDASVSLWFCGMIEPLLRSKRITLWTSTSWWMPLCDQMLLVTASQSFLKKVNDPWSWCACDWSYWPATNAIQAASVSQLVRANSAPAPAA